jgi:hypothetical protein
MPPPRQASKFDCGSCLFRPEPPLSRALVKKLFRGRAKELQRGLATLKHDIDLGGKQAKARDKKPWLIQGEARSGKSHLARRILAGMPCTSQRIQFVISARDKAEAVRVMASLFWQLMVQFRKRTSPMKRVNAFHADQDLQLVDELVEKTALFLHEAQSGVAPPERQGESTIEIGGEVSDLLEKLLSKHSSRHCDPDSLQVVLKPPTAAVLAEICGVMVEALARRKLLRHVLILIDDVDLLVPQQASQPDRSIQRGLLADALYLLHCQPGIDVIMTARSGYAHTRKDFQTLVNLTDGPMLPEELVAIHDGHVRTFARRLPGGRFLKADSLRTLAEATTGLPGVFLQYLQVAHYEYQQDDDWNERDLDWFLDIFRRWFKLYGGKSEPGAELPEQALQDSRPAMMLPAEQPPPTTELASLLVPLAGQFAVMQQQMVDQFKQGVLMIGQMFGDLHREQLTLIRGELDRLQQITQELHQLKQPNVSAEIVAQQVDVGPAPATLLSAAATENCLPAAPPAEDIHELINQRIAALQVERQSLWQRILSFLKTKRQTEEFAQL